jgi:hypothetical protein
MIPTKAAPAPPAPEPTSEDRAFLRGRIEGLREAARVVGDFDIGQDQEGDRLLNMAGDKIRRRADALERR